MKRAIRRQQTIDRADRLAGAIRDWVESWRTDDEDDANPRAGRHRTHLNAIDSVLGGAAAALLGEARALSTASDEGLVYQQCREVDETVAWLYRLWDFYRQRLDQRRDASASIRDTVAACDEIVWSVWAQVFASPAVRRAKIGQSAAPLPYVHDEYSPAAIDQLGVSMRMPLAFPTWDGQLQTLVDQLAAPLLETPRWCVGAPWWLVFVAHEVGHHLNKRLALLGPLQEAIVDRVTPAADADTARAWASWGEEILADAWSAAFLGRAAPEALAEIELSSPESMRRQWTREYPPSALRLALLGRVCGALSLGEPSLPAICSAASLEADAELAPLAKGIDQVREVLLGQLPGGIGTMASLTGLAADAFTGGVSDWAMRLRRDEAAPVKTLPAARLLVAGCFQAWQSLRADAETPAAQADPDAAVARFTQASDALARSATTRLVASGPPGTRASTERATAGRGPGEDPESAKALAQRLLALARQGALAVGGSPAGRAQRD